LTNRGGQEPPKSDVVVVLFAGRRLPRALRDLPLAHLSDVADLPHVQGPADLAGCRRVVVVGSHADLAAVLTRLLRADRLDMEVGHVRRWWQARRARVGEARRVPLIRDETGSVIVGNAEWLPAEDQLLLGEAVVDDTVLFDGDVAGVRVEPTPSLPGLRARVHGKRRWVTGRAVQLGSTGVTVVRDGVPAPRAARRSTFYRNVEGWLSVR
jgi:hypothetical protein